jgi:hypothetical protein
MAEQNIADMKERFNDDGYYSEEQDFGDITVRNCRKVLAKYHYSRYVARFRALADQHELSRDQRPKLDQNEFDSFMRKLGDSLAAFGEDGFLEDPKTVQLASRLLILGLLDEDSF